MADMSELHFYQILYCPMLQQKQARERGLSPFISPIAVNLRLGKTTVGSFYTMGVNPPPQKMAPQSAFFLSAEHQFHDFQQSLKIIYSGHIQLTNNHSYSHLGLRTVWTRHWTQHAIFLMREEVAFPEEDLREHEKSVQTTERNAIYKKFKPRTSELWGGLVNHKVTVLSYLHAVLQF